MQSQSTTVHLPTLSTLTAQSTFSKRKRSVTHYDGIPLSILPPSPTSFQSESNNDNSESSINPSYVVEHHGAQTETHVQGRGRRIITKRKLKDLDRAMKSFNIGAIDEGKRIQSGNNSTRSSGSFVSTVSSLDADGGGHEVQYGYESVTTRPSSSMFDDSSNDDDEEEEEDSDDEDDVVFVLHP